MHEIPHDLTNRPFTRSEARLVGVSSRMLEGRRFERIHHGVWHVREHEMTWTDWVAASRLALPARAHLTGITRIQELGLDFGPRYPLRFVIAGDHHLALDRVFLHRTKKLPPTSSRGVIVEAAFIAYCARARLLDAIVVGDWLLQHKHMVADRVRDLALAQRWRNGAAEALYVLPSLRTGSRSVKESEARAVIEAAGLPCPEVNVPMPVEMDRPPIGDLYYPRWRTAVEFEGAQHQEDRRQYVLDVDRYATLRAHDIAYVQVTKERIAQPRLMVGEVYRTIRKRGYEGPPPDFGAQWKALFAPVSTLVGSRRDYLRGLASGAVS